MFVLGSIRASFVVHFTAGLGLGTILLCYVLAVAYGHVPVWLPMISDCAVRAPEKFPFRFGLVTTSLLLALENVIVYLSAVPRSAIAMLLGLVASLCLGIVGVVNEDEASKVHSVTAVIFFVLYWGNMVVLTVLSSRTLLPLCCSRNSPSGWKIGVLLLRQILTVICGVALIITAILSSTSWGKNKIYIALCEWIGTIAILTFIWSFSSDLANVSIAEVQSQPKTGSRMEYNNINSDSHDDSHESATLIVTKK